VQRNGLRVLLALARRPRGARLLARLPSIDQAARATLAMVRYDDPRVAERLGWDAHAVIARGREAKERRAEAAEANGAVRRGGRREAAEANGAVRRGGRREAAGADGGMRRERLA
jgi:hypothetical protein